MEEKNENIDTGKIGISATAIRGMNINITVNTDIFINTNVNINILKSSNVESL